MPVLRSAADCTPPDLYARGLNALDQAEAAMTPDAVTSFAELAQAYFQAVSTAVAMSMAPTSDFSASPTVEAPGD